MKLKFALAALVLTVLTAAAHAQGGTVTSGCGDSPENPTAILAVAGSAGAFVATTRRRFEAALRCRLGSRRKRLGQ